MIAVYAILGILFVAAAGYAGLVLWAWVRYGRPAHANALFADALLDRFMPEYDVVERHAVIVNAPADVTLAAAMDYSIDRSPIVRLIFKVRAMVLHAETRELPPSGGLIAQTKALGWGELAAVPGREIVMGAITRPWRAEPTFQSLRQTEFARFDLPGFVKIAWTLSADPLGDGRSVFRTETRAIATDPVSRRRFRGYWARFSPGIWLIRQMSLRPIKSEGERRAAARRVRKLAV